MIIGCKKAWLKSLEVLKIILGIDWIFGTPEHRCNLSIGFPWVFVTVYLRPPSSVRNLCTSWSALQRWICAKQTNSWCHHTAMEAGQTNVHPLKITWLAGKSTFLIGDIYICKWLMFQCHVIFSGVYLSSSRNCSITHSPTQTRKP